MSATSAPVCFRIMPPRVRHGWLPYFLAAMGAGSALADEELLRYWWVMPDAPAEKAPRVMPDAPAEKAPRVIRVLGEKGERFEEVYAAETRAELKSEPAILRARLARQATLRRKAVQLARQLRESGKSPLVAYEEAWTRVYAENRLAAAGLTLSSWLEETLARLASGQKLTEEEVQWILEALLADDDSLEDEAGQELLRRLAEHLRAMGYGLFDVPTVNDELMQRFAEAMRHKGCGVGAYRDALFKTHRDRVMFHSLNGYRAPWGAGVGRNLHYRQTPRPVGVTKSSGNTWPLHTPGGSPPFTAPGLNALPGSVTNFLATSPPAKGEKDEEESDEEKKDEYQEQDEQDKQIVSALPPLMNTFSLRSAALAPMAIAEDGAPGDMGTGNDGILHWNSVAGQPAVWDTEQTPVWVDGQGGETLYMAGSSVEFGNGADLNKSVQVAGAGVEAGTVAITGSGYHFTGGDITVTESLSVTGSAGFDGTLDVGANRITGGTLENVKLQVTGDIWRPVTQDTVTGHNLISAADGTHAAVLTDVQLNAGTATEYATLHNVVFAGDSTLTGYITIEKIQAQREIGVATGSTLKIDNATFDLRGMTSGPKVLIVNGALDDTFVAFALPDDMSGLRGELTGWNTVKFVYSGIAVNKAAVDTSVAGMVTIRDAHGGNLYWNGEADDKWNPGSANWSSSAALEEQETFTALSNVYFGAGNAVNRDITVTQDMVVMNLDVTDGGYSFGGARVAVLGNASLNFDSGVVDFRNQLVVQGNLNAAGSGSLELSNAAKVAGSAALNNLSTTIAGDLSVVGKLAVNAGSDSAAGSLTILGNVEAEEMEFVVNSDAESVKVSGNLTVGTEDDDVGLITIGGAAKQQFTGTVTAKGLIVKGGDVYFSRLQVASLTVDKDATVHVQTSSDSVAVSSSVFPEIYLSGTLALDAPGATYNRGYQVNVQRDAARLIFGDGCTIDNLSLKGNVVDSDYTDLSIEMGTSSATVTKMQDLGNLKVDTGSLTVKNASGAVHGKLILDNAKLKLGEKSGNIMADDSGAVELKNGARLDIGTTTQTLSANNVVSLSGTSSITGEAGGVLLTGSGLCVNYAGNGNSIDAKLSVNEDISLNSTRGGSSLEIAGLISGSGTLDLTGPGSVVISGANAGFTGKVIVEQGATLTLQNTDSLSSASVVLNPGGTLNLDAPGVVNLKALTLQSGSILAISSIVGTNDASSADAVLNIKDGSLELDNVVLNLNFSQELKAMTTYNIMTGVSSSNNLSFNVQHNGVDLHSSQYKIEHKNDLLSIYVYTMTGNVWNGSESGVWTLTDNGGNWSGGAYDDGKAAIFGDLNGGGSNVCLSGDVNPGDIYFTAESTAYTLSDEAGGSLAAGTHIHKLGAADATLALAENATMGTALGNVDIRDGTLILSKALAVNGAVTVDAGAKLEVNPGTDGLILANYKASANAANDANKSATLSGVTMDAAGIRGTEEAPGSANNLRVQGNAGLSWLELTDFAANVELTDLAANGDVALSHVKLLSSAGASSHVLKNVTIGQEVVVGESASYTLSGAITFDAMLINNGAVTLDGITSVEIGKIAPSGGAAGNYTYQLIGPDPDKTNGTNNVAWRETQTPFTQYHVYINGVNLGVDLVEGMVTGFKYVGNGSFTLSIGKEKEDGTIDGNFYIPRWDEHWGKTEMAPALSRLYVGDSADATVVLPNGNVVLPNGNVVLPNDNVVLPEDAEYYEYSSIVKDASNVNNGNAIVVSLDEAAKGKYVVGGNIVASGSAKADHEVWIYDSSGVRNIIGGLTGELTDDKINTGVAATNPQTAATHVLVDSNATNDYTPKDKDPEWKYYVKEFVIGGSRWCNQNAESFVTVQSGEIYNVFGGSCGGRHGDYGWQFYHTDENVWVWFDWKNDEWIAKPYLTQTGTAHVFVHGGTIGEIFAAGYYANLVGTQVVNGRKRAVEMVLTGGNLGKAGLRVFGGAANGVVEGDIYIRMEGSANVETRLVGGSNSGVVYGNIELDLISGSAFRVDAAGLGWKDGDYYAPTRNDGDVLVNLYTSFKLGTGAEEDYKSGIYGGMETTNHVLLTENSFSRLHFAESGEYELGYIDSDGLATTDSHYVTGFGRFELEDDAHVVLSLGYFDVDMDPAKTLVISGKGVVEVIGRGSNFGRNIELQKGATLKISTCDIGTTGSEDVRTITVTDGTTVDFTGFSITGLDPATPGKAGLDFNVKICGNGVDGKGALYMGQSTQTSNDTNKKVNKIYLPHVELTDNASVKVVAQEALYMDSVKLAGYTLTKLGSGDFITRSVEKVDEKTTGTILVQQGSFGFAQGDTAAETDVVLAAGAELRLNATGLEATALTLRSLNGAGTVHLNGSTLTLETKSGSVYYGKYMDEKQSYDQFLGTTGFGYAVFSGLISDGSTAGSLVKDGSGVHYISGSSNTYTGGTQLQEGRLYLLGTGEASLFKKEMTEVTAGVAGAGDIVWDSADAELYLGHGSHIYNNGTASVQDGKQVGVMTIGVEGALMGTLAKYIGLHSRPEEETGAINYVNMGGEDYVEIDTHSLKSIPVDAVYANGTAYKANTDIDRNLMLLVKATDWESVKNTAVTCLSASGYNEASYSGVLRDSSADNTPLVASLLKTGLGTLVLDQVNTYTGGTKVAKGTLRLRGWGTVGSGDAVVNDGASLMLSYNLGYGDAETVLDNDIKLSGSGDEQWSAYTATEDGPHALTDGRTAALISAVGQSATVVLNGDIKDAGESVSGGVLHSGDGTLVLRGDSSYTGGTHITRGVVDVQSESGLGDTASGKSKVVLEAAADLRVTVKPDCGDDRLVTTLASVADDIQGDVIIEGTGTTERVLHMEGNGYKAASTSLGANGTFLLSGTGEAGISSQSKVLSGTGAVVVSDASGKGTVASFDSMVDYTGDFRVEGDRAAIQVKTGSFIDGSIHVAGQQASVNIGGSVSIAASESLHLRSTGVVPARAEGGTPSYGTGAALISEGAVSVAAGATLSVSRIETDYAYNINKLEKAVSLTPEDVTLSNAAQTVGKYTAVGSVDTEYREQFDTKIAINQQAAGAVKAKAAGGITLVGGSTYEINQAHISLMGGSLTLDTMEHHPITLNATLEEPADAMYNGAQLVLFSGVSSVTFGYGNDEAVTAKSGSGVYYTRADRYVTGSDYVNSETMLVYDSEAGVVYLQWVPQQVPEPATTTLSLLALTALLARRRRA